MALRWNSPTVNDWNVSCHGSLFFFLNRLLICVSDVSFLLFLLFESLCLASKALSSEDGASLGQVKQVRFTSAATFEYVQQAHGASC